MDNRMVSDDLAKRVQIVLDSDLTGYEIEKETDIARSSISRYRRGHLGPENMTLDIARRFEKIGIEYGLFDSNDETHT